MKCISIILLLLFLASCDQIYSKYHVDYSDVVYNYDGDTILINCIEGLRCGAKGVSIRVRHVDTPEIKGSCEHEKQMAYDAKLYTNNALKQASNIVLKVNQLDMYDRYNRLLADVLIDGESLGVMLVNNKLGRPYEGGHRNGWCNKY